jgi:hypothetical protein
MISNCFIFFLVTASLLIKANYIESDFLKSEPFLQLKHTELIPQEKGEVKENKTHYKGSFKDGYWHNDGRLAERLFY